MTLRAFKVDAIIGPLVIAVAVFIVGLAVVFMAWAWLVGHMPFDEGALSVPVVAGLRVVGSLLAGAVGAMAFLFDRAQLVAMMTVAALVASTHARSERSGISVSLGAARVTRYAHRPQPHSPGF